MQSEDTYALLQKQSLCIDIEDREVFHPSQEDSRRVQKSGISFGLLIRDETV
jgi:hypothetical protein